ncbi:SCO7613 C-terminal domain-containing membrane protein, partial [Actinocorallia lasiicapitis]
PAALVVAGAAAVPGRFRAGSRVAGLLVLGPPVLWTLGTVAPALAGVDDPDVPVQGLIVLGAVAALLFSARKLVGGVVVTAVAISAVPSIAGLGLATALSVQLSVTAALFALAYLVEPDELRAETALFDRRATLAALGAAVIAIGWSFDDETATVVTLSVVFLLCTALAALVRTNTVAAVAAVLVSGGLCGAVAELASWPTPPEVFTIPVTAGGLLLGYLWRGRLASSWAAYGPALTITLLPSLLMVWDEPGWQRPLLLGVAALAITLFGLRHRLQAPALLGGVTLLLDVAHELAPHVAQLAGLLPRWIPIAAAGLLLLVLGATYERRLRELRALHARFTTMH